ncbi:TPA: hypothetical protein ACF35M_003880, partial [Vibrio parahaemolyticus]
NYLLDAVEKATGYKRQYSYEIDYEDLGSSKSNKSACKAYFEFHNSSVLEVPEVSGTKPYFMRGKVHEAINNNAYTWKYNEEDID